MLAALTESLWVSDFPKLRTGDPMNSKNTSKYVLYGLSLWWAQISLFSKHIFFPKDVNGSFCHHLVCNSVLVSWYSHQYFLISCCYDSGFDPHHPHYRSTINICRESWFGSLIRSYCHKDREHLGFYKPLNSLCLQYF